jgi:TatD DNase family protein
MNYIDTHAHLYDPAFADDLDQILERARHAGLSAIYLPNCDVETIAPMLAVEAQSTGLCHAMMGLHPTYVKDDFITQLATMEDLLKTRPFAGIGEIGLDLYWDKTFYEQQVQAFEIQVGWAARLSNLPIIVHSREATQQCIDAIKRVRSTPVKGIFHCFNGTRKEAQQIVDLGMLLGIGGSITYKKSTLPDIIRSVGIDHLVLETDAPYLAPVPHRGKRNESSYLPLVAEAISHALALPVEEVAAITTANAKKLFSTD